MQQSPQMMPTIPSTNITTEQIQRCLDENKRLILAILDNQNVGKIAECAQYQAQLQRNLMYLAAIADAQPPMQTAPAEMLAHPGMQQGGFYMQQHPQTPTMATQSGLFPGKSPLQFNNPHHQMQDAQQLHRQPQQAFQMQMGMRSMGSMHPMHSDGTPSSIGPTDIRGRNSEADATGTDGHDLNESK